MFARYTRQTWLWIAVLAVFGAFAVAVVPQPYRSYTAQRTLEFSGTRAASVLALVDPAIPSAAAAASIHISPRSAATAMVLRAHGDQLELSFRAATRSQAQRALDAVDDAISRRAAGAAQEQIDTTTRALRTGQVAEHAARAVLAQADRRTHGADVDRRANVAARTVQRLRAQRASAAAAHDSVLVAQLDDRIATSQQQMFDLADLVSQRASLSRAVTDAVARRGTALDRLQQAVATDTAITSRQRVVTDAVAGNDWRAASVPLAAVVAMFLAVALFAIGQACRAQRSVRLRRSRYGARATAPVGERFAALPRRAVGSGEHDQVIDIVAAATVEHATAGHEA